MATPRVFISSTFYDLNEIRETIENYLNDLGFETVLSDKGHIYYQPGLHTHESCLKEVGNCNLFILIIGGRYGGAYVGDENRSIVNAEYDVAKSERIPIVTFIKKTVWDNHLFYLKNKGNDKDGIIEYPAIENQKTAIKIFEFIDRVRLAEKNNGVFPFGSSNELIDILKKQFAGMIFNHLYEERIENTENVISDQLNDLKNQTLKSNEMLEKLFVQLFTDSNSTEQLKEIEQIQAINNFFFYLHQFFNISKLNDWQPLLKKKESQFPIDWHSYILMSSDFQIMNSEKDNTNYLVHINSLKSMPINDDDHNYKLQSKFYSSFASADLEKFNQTLTNLFNE
jgi:hypothetical protein